MNRRHALLASSLLLAQPGFTQTPDWPNKPVKLVVPFPPGGPADVVARVLGEVLAKRTGQAFIVENRPGAVTTIGSEYVMRTPPDGYTMLVNASGAYSLNPYVMTMRYDPLKDVPPLTMLAGVQQVLVVSSSRNLRNIADLMAFGKANPKQMNFGTVGTGTINHLLGEILLRNAKLTAVQAPYPGAPAAITAIIGGEILAAVVDVPPAIPQIQSGKLTGLAVFSPQRSPFLPNVPTTTEQGFASATTEGSYGLFTPAKMNSALAIKIRTEVTAAMEDGTLRERFKTLGLVPRTTTAEQFQALIEADSGKFGPVAKELGIRTN
ncbi:Bug family tripartite tricarboxylate transporter substrate binding protein [Polaromonas sp.]|uniref:Bug family tripartite tricarboxylate transporter substrate binding protein n=1 Tax=Polaromonas sp. TaxID=1869339 RepID=UPI003BAA5BC2